LALLQSAIAAAGGPQAIQAIRDFSASGNITHFWSGQEVTGAVEIRGRGLDQVRMDSHLQDGTHSLVVNHGPGKTTHPGTSRNISADNGFRLGLLILPLPGIAAAVADPQAGVLFKGTEQVGTVLAYRIEIIRGVPPQLNKNESLRRLKTMEVFLDAKTSMVVAVRQLYSANEFRPWFLAREVDFSDFRQVGQVVVPFAITEKAVDQRTWTISLARIDFNVGVLDSIFQQ
jgi:hypothetical protein